MASCVPICTRLTDQYISEFSLGTFTATTSTSSPELVHNGIVKWCNLNPESWTAGAVKRDGTFWTWGNNTCGRLGDNSITNKSSMVQTVSGGTNWRQISSTPCTTAAIKTDGTLWMWGRNDNCLLGIDSTDFALSRSSPVQTASGGTNWRHVALTYSPGLGAAATKTDGTLWMWGSYMRPSGINTYQARVPVQRFSSGAQNWCCAFNTINGGFGVRTDGTLWTWGNAPIGTGAYLLYSSPVQTVLTGAWCQVAGDSIAIAGIRPDGTLWLWGCGYSGELGNNRTGRVSSPVQTVSAGTNWRQVAKVGNGFAAIKTDGTLWHWGNYTSFSSCLPGGPGNCARSSPVQVISGGTDWSSVGRIQQGVLMTKTDGSLWAVGDMRYMAPQSRVNSSTAFEDIGCKLVTRDFLIDVYPTLNPNIKRTGLFGSGVNTLGSGYGTLATGDTINRSSPVQTIAGGSDWARLADSFVNPIAAIKTNGSLWLWGRSAGRGVFGTGNGADLCVSSPIQTITGSCDWAQVSLGSVSAAAVKTNGTLWTWGFNNQGRNGNNSIADVCSPVQTVAGGNDWRCVLTNVNFTAAIKTDGTLWTWGYNLNGQLGINNTINRSSPGQTISGGNNWTRISLGCNHMVSIKSDGTLWTWGLNSSGQLGDNTNISKSSPVQTISGGSDWSTLGKMTETSSSAAIKTNGSLWLWGSSANWILGNNVNNVNRSSPVQTNSGGRDWRQVALFGQSHATALKIDGRRWIWGLGTCGAFGSCNNFNWSVPIILGNECNVYDIGAGYRSTFTLKDFGDL